MNLSFGQYVTLGSLSMAAFIKLTGFPFWSSTCRQITIAIGPNSNSSHVRLEPFGITGLARDYFVNGKIWESWLGGDGHEKIYRNGVTLLRGDLVNSNLREAVRHGRLRE